MPERIWSAIQHERVHQEKKHGYDKSCANPHVHPDRKLTILAEEFGEVAMALNDTDFNNLRDELVQVAAVAVAWLESMDA